MKVNFEQFKSIFFFFPISRFFEEVTSSSDNTLYVLGGGTIFFNLIASSRKLPLTVRYFLLGIPSITIGPIINDVVNLFSGPGTLYLKAITCSRNTWAARRNRRSRNRFSFAVSQTTTKPALNL